MTTLRHRALPLAILAAALLLPAAPSPAERFTDHLDDLEAELELRDAALEGELTRDQKKEKKGYGKALAALAQDAAALPDELKLAGKAAKFLEKGVPGDGAIAGLLADAAAGLEVDAEEFVAGLGEDVDGRADSRAQDRAERALDAAQTLLDGAALEEQISRRLGFLLKAMKKTTPAQKFLAGGGGGGGGGAGCYPGTRTLAGGESSSASWDGGSFTATAVEIAVQTVPFSRKTARFTSCSPSLVQRFIVSLAVTPEVDTPYPFDQNSLTGVYYASGTPEGLLATRTGYGTLTFTEVNASTGTYAGTFTFTTSLLDIQVSDGTFRITGLQ